MNLFGFEIKRKSKELDDIQTPITTDVVDDLVNLKVDSSPGTFRNSISAINIDIDINNENRLIEQYRQLVNVPEVNRCVNEIVSEAIVYPDLGKAVRINVDDVKTSDEGKEKIVEAFEYIYELLMFDRKGHEIFKRWYIDGRINYFVGIDQNNPADGIQYLQYVDPRKIKKVKEIKREYDSSSQSLIIKNTASYFVYNEMGLGQQIKQANMATAHVQQHQNKILTEDSVIYVPSGEVDPQCGLVIGHLHNAVRISNNLRMMEDSALIYRLARAPERRVIYVDTGDLSKAKAEQYVQELSNKQRAKMVFDATSGEIKNDRKYLALTEDFWIPRRGGSTGTAIETLPGGQMVGEMGEAEYFKEKLYVALGVPESRFQESTMFSGGTQITRDELRFSRMVSHFRTSFSVLFEELLKRQLLLTSLIDVEDWKIIKNQIRFEFAEDSHFAEAIRQERLQSMANVIQMLDQYVGKYFSKEYIYEHVIGMTEEEMKEQQKLIAANKELQKELSVDQNSHYESHDFDKTKSDNVLFEDFGDFDLSEFDALINMNK